MAWNSEGKRMEGNIREERKGKQDEGLGERESEEGKGNVEEISSKEKQSTEIMSRIIEERERAKKGRKKN